MISNKMNVICGVIMMCTGALGAKIVNKHTGFFWQVTDFHHDANYSRLGDPELWCHKATTDSPFHLGEYGDYRCDIPWMLVKSAIKAMRKLYPNPDFILWTGDNIAHVPDSQINTDKVLTIIGNVTDLLTNTFPDTPIYPCLGNHDSVPSQELPAGNSSYYGKILNNGHWNKILQSVDLKTFKKGGFYSTSLSSNVRLLSLNSILWLERNKLTADMADPASQFDWFEKELFTAKELGEKVIVIGHVPAGTSARNANDHYLRPIFNKRYMEIVADFWDVISAQIFAHEHSDGFHVFYKEKKPVGVSFMAPAVTPSTNSNNPTIRLYQYYKATGDILDIHQYYLNLSAANAHKHADWLKEYQATKDYGIPDVNARSMDELVSSFSDQNSDNFKKYIRFNSASYSNQTCDELCKQKHICAIKYVDYDDYSTCMQKPADNKSPVIVNNAVIKEMTPLVTKMSYDWIHHHPHHHPKKDVPHHMRYVIYGLVGLVIIFFIILTIVCCSRKQRVVHVMAYPRYVLIDT